MSDNVTVDNVDLADYVVATDDDGTAQHQYVKLEFGGDGTFSKVSAANPVPVTGTALSGTVAVSSLAAGTNTLGTVALVGALPAGSGFLGTVANAGTVAISSIVTQLPAGTNTLGTVARVGATPTGSNFIGTVANAGTVAISSLAAGVNTLGTVALVGAVPTGSNFIGTVANAGTVAISSIVSALPAGTNTLGTVATIGGSNSGTTAGIGTFTTKETRSTTGTLSHVSPSSTVVGLMNTNSNRLGLSVTNDATGNLYLALNSNASTTDYTARLAQFDYWEAPFNYTGTVTGLWSTVVASDGAARITEYS